MSEPLARDGLLRRALQANAASCVILGAVVFLAARPLVDAIGLTDAVGVAGALALAFGAGLALVAGGGGLWALARHTVLDRWLAGVATGVDVMCVVGAAALWLLVGAGMPVAGRWLLVGVADVAALFAVTQSIGLWRMRFVSSQAPAHGSVRWHSGAV